MLHQRDSARSALFGAYTGDRPLSSSRPNSTGGYVSARTQKSNSPSLYAENHGPRGQSPANPYRPSDGPYSSSTLASSSSSASGAATTYRSAKPNSKGQYSNAVLSELENQNDANISNMSAKVKMLKDLTVAIGDEIKSSTTLAETMNERFEGTRVRLRGTMNRMLVMAEKTGIGWRIWLGFFAFVWLLFVYVWLF